MKNKEVINNFITQEKNINGNNLFIDNNVLYSYGYQYPLCFKYKINNKTIYLVNKDRYSITYLVNKDRYLITTTKHKNLLISSLKHNINEQNIIFLETHKLKTIINKYINTKNKNIFSDLIINKLTNKKNLNALKT